MSGKVLQFVGIAFVIVIANQLTADPPKEDPKPKIPPVVKVSHKKAQTEVDIRKALSEPGGTEFIDTPLSDALVFLEDVTGTNFLLDRETLRKDGISELEPIDYVGDKVSFACELDRILEPLELRWFIQYGVVHITTMEAAEETMITRMYDVKAILEYGKKHHQDVVTGSGFPLGWRNNFPGFETVDSPDAWLTDLVYAMVDGPWVAIDGLGGMTFLIHENFVLRHSHRGHDLAAALFQTLTQLTKGKLPQNPIAIRPPHYPHAQEEQIKKALAKVIDINSQKRPLNLFLAYIGEQLKIPVHLHKSALKENNIPYDKPVTLVLKNVTARSALKMALKPLGLREIVEDGRVFVTTVEESEKHLYTKIHDLREMYPVGFYNEDLPSMLMETTNVPWLVIDGTGGQIMDPLEGVLFVNQTEEGHNEVEAILAKLQIALKKNPVKININPPPDPKENVARYYRVEGIKNPVSFVNALTRMVEPQTWTKNGGTGELLLDNNKLVVFNRLAVQEKVSTFLTKLQELDYGDIPQDAGAAQ